jgi:hypothetical protein
MEFKIGTWQILEELNSSTLPRSTTRKLRFSYEMLMIARPNNEDIEELCRTALLSEEHRIAKSEEPHDLPVSMSASQNGSEMVRLPHLLAEQPPSCSVASATTDISGSQKHDQKNQQLRSMAVEDLELLP